MKNSHKIFTYSDESNYVVCTCEISNQARIKIKESIKKNKVSYDVIHKLENMISSNEIIDLNELLEDIINDTEKMANVTADFLDSLEIKGKKIIPVDQVSQEWSYLQRGTFSLKDKNKKQIKAYQSSLNNNKILKTIGYDLHSRFNRKQIKGMEKKKILQD